MRMTPRPRAPPSSFKDGASPRTPLSRPGSRAGAETPEGIFGEPAHFYAPASHRDPLDMEVANILNSLPHSLMVERIDPPLKTTPKAGEEIRAQYAFSNQLGRKLVTCKLTTMTRSGTGTTKKVMCRVGGGEFLEAFQDLSVCTDTRCYRLARPPSLCYDPSICGMRRSCLGILWVELGALDHMDRRTVIGDITLPRSHPRNLWRMSISHVHLCNMSRAT